MCAGERICSRQERPQKTRGRGAHLGAPRIHDEKSHAQREDQAQSHLDEQASVWGIVLDAPIDVRERLDTFHLFPENELAWHLFLAVQTEWRGTMDRVGLDKPGVLSIIDQRRKWRNRRREMFASVVLMERTALVEWAAMAAESQPGGAR
jgi:hypothetical protein